MVNRNVSSANLWMILCWVDIVSGRIESRVTLGSLKLEPIGISEVQQGETQTSDEMIFVVTVDAKFNINQERVLTGSSGQLFSLLYVVECYGVLCVGNASLIVAKFSNTFHLLLPNMQRSRWVCIVSVIGDIKQEGCIPFHWPLEMVARSPRFLGVWQIHAFYSLFILSQTTKLFEAVVLSLPEVFRWNFSAACQPCLLCETAKEVVTDWFAVPSIWC